MYIFISYSRHERQLAERINTALRAAGFDTFLDTKSLPIGQEFNARIKLAVDAADLFLFLASPNAVRPGSYTLTELSFAESKWRNPSGYVLPVLLGGLDPGQLPAYLRPVNALQIKGNVEAEVVGWALERATRGTAGAPGILTPLDRLKYWARLAQPPIRKGRKVMPWGGCAGVAVGSGFVALGLRASFDSSGAGFSPIWAVIHLLIVLIGLFVVIYSFWMVIQGLRGGATPVAVVILDRETRENSILIHAQTLEEKRLKLSPITKSALEAYPGDLGWAYIRGGLLLEFIPASAHENQS